MTNYSELDRDQRVQVRVTSRLVLDTRDARLDTAQAESIEDGITQLDHAQMRGVTG